MQISSTLITSCCNKWDKQTRVPPEQIVAVERLESLLFLTLSQTYSSRILKPQYTEL